MEVQGRVGPGTPLRGQHEEGGPHRGGAAREERSKDEPVGPGAASHATHIRRPARPGKSGAGCGEGAEQEA